jgi:SAM-dependent methyltransferase
MTATKPLLEIGTKNDTLACLVCRKEQAYIYHVGVREDPEQPVYLCSYCRLLFLDILDCPFTDLREYYRKEYRKTHDYTPGKQLIPEERFMIQYPLMEASASYFMENVPEGTSVLEIGCSAGGFLGHLVEGYDCYGNEWNPEDAKYVRDVGEIPCEEGNLDEIYPGKTFGAIVAISVFEHVIDPIEWLKQVRSKLIGGGYLYLEVPNVNDILASAYDCPEYKQFWYRQPHLTYWNADVLAAALTSMGFEAKVSFFQRYGLWNHMNWLMLGKPMEDPIQARMPYRPMPKDHPAGASVNREWIRLDKQYRVMVESLLATDSLRTVARRRDI